MMCNYTCCWGGECTEGTIHRGSQLDGTLSVERSFCFVFPSHHLSVDTLKWVVSLLVLLLLLFTYSYVRTHKCMCLFVTYVLCCRCWRYFRNLLRSIVPKSSIRISTWSRRNYGRDSCLDYGSCRRCRYVDCISKSYQGQV